MGRVRLGRVGSHNSSPWVGRVQNYLINIQFACKKPIIRRLQFIMIRSCNIAIYYHLYLFIPTSRTCYLGKRQCMAREVMMLASEVKSYLVDKLNDSAADGKTKSWVGLGRVGSLHLWVRLGRVKNWTNVQLCVMQYRIVSPAIIICTGHHYYPLYVSIEALYLVAVFFSVRLQISRRRWHRSLGVKFCLTVHIGPGQTVSPFWGGTSRGPHIRNVGTKLWPFDREYLENGKSQRYMSIRA